MSPLRNYSSLALCVLISTVSISCIDDTATELPQIGESSAAMTYDVDGRAYLAKFEVLGRERLVMRAEDPVAFHQLLKNVYGAGYAADVAEDIRERIVQRDFSWAPDVQLVPEQVLGGASGAYSEAESMVYLSEDIPDHIQRTMVYLEEIGHHLDVLLNRTDTPGDEGGLFRMALVGAQLSPTQEAMMRSEDDHGVIFYDGRRIEVEYFFAWDWLSDAWSGIVDAWEWASPRVFWAAVDQIVIAVDAAKTLKGAVEGGTSYLSSGVQKLAEGDISGGLNDLFRGAVAMSIKPVASVVITLLLHEVAAIQTLIFGPGREFTAEEKNDLRRIYGDVWWLDVVRVVEGKLEAGVFMASKDPFTLELTIYLKGRDARRDLIVHESFHVFQWVSGDGTYKLMSVYDRQTNPQDNYNWEKPANAGKPFTEFGVEQQAEFIEDAFLNSCFAGPSYSGCYIREGGIWKNRTPLKAQVQRAVGSGIWRAGVLPPTLIVAVAL